MNTKLLALSLLLLSIFGSNAQPAWRAKLFVHFLDANNQVVTDTVNFGCDSLGNIGYQEGLDIFDTVPIPNTVLGFDSLVQIQRQTDCVNLRQNVKNFSIGLTDFNFYALGHVCGISWDTTDFIYADPTYKLRGVRLTSKNVYLRSIDSYQHIVYNENRRVIKFSEDSIMVVPDFSPAYDCSFSSLIAHIRLEVVLGYGGVGLTEDLSKIMEYDAFPIPTDDLLHINFDIQSDYKIVLTNTLGIVVLTTNFKDAKNDVNTGFLPDGLYYMTLTDEKHRVRNTQKLIILH